jgi:hypothetical protein
MWKRLVCAALIHHGGRDFFRWQQKWVNDLNSIPKLDGITPP